jgi:hypothetical protein
MSNHTIPTKCLHRLLRNEIQHCYDHETTQRRFDAAFDWANDAYPRKKICGLAWIIANEIEKSLIDDVNSTFLTVADLRRKHDNDTVILILSHSAPPSMLDVVKSSAHYSR